MILKVLLKHVQVSMQKLSTHIFSIGAGIAIGILLSNQCNPSQTTERIIHDTIYGDSIPYVVYQGIPKPYAVHHWHTDSFTRIDTLEVIREHFASNRYIDTLKNDTSALIVLNELVERNKIASRELIFQNRRPIAINSYHEPRGIVVGGMIGQRMIGADVGYQWKQNTLRLGYSTQGIYAGFSYRVN